MKRILVGTLIAVALLSSNLLAQSSDEIKLPPIHKQTLANGMELVVVEHSEVPVVAFMLVVKTGDMQDPAGKAGLANFVVDLLRQGTKTRTATQISDQIDFIGGSLGGGADYDYLSVSCQALKKYFGQGLDLLSDVVLNPAFAEQEIERLRSRRIGEIKESMDDPEIGRAHV